MLCKKRTIIIQPVGIRCNLACKYCYHGKREISTKTVISEEVLQQIYRQSAEIAENVTFLWHGGEPLLAGIDFFERALDLQRSVRFIGRVRNTIQTNGTLIDEEWTKLFVRRQMGVSISIDGPKELHDINRVDFAGCGSFDRVIQAIRFLHSGGKTHIGSVVLVTKTNVAYPDEVYRALKNSGLSSCAFHFCSETNDGISHLIPTIEEGIRFFRRVFDLWMRDDDPSFRVRNFLNVLRVLYGGQPLDCASLYGSCHRFVGINNLGDVYFCHRLATRSEFRLGNILEKPLAQILSDAKPLYAEANNIPNECFSCEWFPACGGGCPYERLMAGGSFNTRHPECELKVNLFSYIKKYVGK